MLLCPHNMDEVNITVRCDQATWHTSHTVTNAFKMLNIELSLYKSTTNSKNVIPELDSRIKIYSQYLVQLVEESPFSIETCCYLAAAKTNNSIGQHGMTPAEMFVGRKWPSGEQFKVDTAELIKSIKSKRLSRREYEERKAAEKYLGKQQKFIPYADKSLNAPLVNNPNLLNLKVGDLITLKEKIDKNEPRCAYQIEKLSFPNNKVLVRRYSGLDKDSPDTKWIDFKIIHSAVSNTSNLNLIEKVDLDYFIDKSVSAVNQIVYLPSEFETEIHHSIKSVHSRRMTAIPPARDFILELDE